MGSITIISNSDVIDRCYVPCCYGKEHSNLAIEKGWLVYDIIGPVTEPNCEMEHLKQSWVL